MNTNKPLKRPFLIVLLCLVFAAGVVFGWIRAEQAVQNWKLEADLVGSWMPIYSVTSGALWGLAGAPAIAGLWRRLWWARRAAWAAAFFYPLSFWLEKVLVLQSPERLTNWPFDAGATLFWLIFVALALRLKSSRQFLIGK